MKRLIIFLFLLVFFQSCKKDYTCTCSYMGIKTSTEYSGINKNDAKAYKENCEIGVDCVWAEK